MVFSLRLCRSSSAVHDDENPSEEEKVVETTSGTSLTVWRKSLLFTCNGFTVIDRNGSLAYRVDNYIGRPLGEVVLMDTNGKSILTVRRRKNLSLVDDWLIYEGESSNDNFGSFRKENDAFSSSSSSSTHNQTKQKPSYCVRKHLSMLKSNSSRKETSQVLAHVYTVGCKPGDQGNCRKSRSAYVIEGSYGKRSCKVLDCRGSKKNVVAEIKRKEAINGSASFGSEVFHLIVMPGFDSGFAMALVLLLDQMFT